MWKKEYFDTEEKQHHECQVGILHIRSLEQVKDLLIDIASVVFVIDFSLLPEKEQIRARDILEGALYANQGKLQKVVETVYVSIPAKMKISHQKEFNY